MNLSVGFIYWLDAVILIQGLLFGTMLIFLYSKKHKPTFFLGAFVLLFSLNAVSNQELTFLFTSSKSGWLLDNFGFFSYPFLYLYIQRISILDNEHFSYWTLIPGVFELVTALFVWLLYGTNLGYSVNTFQLYYYGASLFFNIWIGMLILMWIRSHSVALENQYAQVRYRKLNWVKWFIYVSITCELLKFLNTIQTSHTLYTVLGVFNIVLIYWISFKGIQQRRVAALVTHKATYHYLMTKLEASQLLDKLNNYIENSKCYVNDKLTIIDLAEAIHVHPKRISYAINSIKGMHFNGYINFFRVGYAKKLLKSTAIEQLSIEGIGMEAGFHSKTTFYSAFKSFEGVTPAKYKSS